MISYGLTKLKFFLLEKLIIKFLLFTKKKYDGYVTIQVLAEERLPPSQTMYPPKTIFETWTLYRIHTAVCIIRQKTFAVQN